MEVNNLPTAALLQTAWDHFRVGQSALAKEAAQRVIEQSPTDVAAWSLLGTIALTTGDFMEGVACFNRALLEAGGSHPGVLNNLGEAYRALGRAADAEACYRRAIELDPSQASAHNNLGILFKEAGDFGAAIQALTAALQLQPEYDAAYNNLGTVYQAQGKAAEAEACYLRALQMNSRLADALGNLGHLRRLQGRFAEAQSILERALMLRPDYADALDQLGLVYYLQQRWSEAEFCFLRSLQVRPNSAETHNHLGMVSFSRGRLAEAHQHYARALELAPNHLHAINNLATLLNATGQVTEAIALYERALELNPGFAGAHNNLGLLLLHHDRVLDARKHLETALRLRPEYVEAHTHLGALEQGMGRHSEAIACYRRAIDLNPSFADARNNLGNVLLAIGDADGAQHEYHQAIEARPDMAIAHSNWLLSQLYRPEATLTQLAELHAEWDQRHGEPLKKLWRPWGNNRDPERRLRLGFVSADLGRHPIGHLLVHMLSTVDRDQFELALYSHRTVHDSVTQRLERQSALFRDVFSLDDAVLAEQIRNDQIDILFDLAGHTAHHRLLTFARKPAPVQVTWMGYPSTTGLKAIDYLIADRFHIPPEHDSWFSERVVRLTEGTACHELPSDAPEVNDLPARQPGHVVLGSFNNPAKINAAVVRVWAEVLRRLPDARLVLKYLGLSDPLPQGRLREMFAAEGIDPGRLEFRDRTPMHEMLAEYHAIDLVLDPFPFTGGTSTMLALSMGVPIVTWPGETFASRQSFSVLSNLGVTETVAQNADDYVEIAVRLAHDLERLAELRRTLRTKLVESCYGNPRRFMHTLAPALRAMWRTWCES